MEPVTTALNFAFSFAGRKLLEAGYKKLTDKSVSDEEYALLTALTTLGDDRQAAGRLALEDWLASREWRTGTILKQLEENGGVTDELLRLFTQRGHGLEIQDRPRVVAEVFLSAYWILYLKKQGLQVLLDKGKITYELLLDMQLSLENITAKQDEMLGAIKQLTAHIDINGESASTVRLAGTPLSPADPYAQKLERIDHSLEDLAFSAARRHLTALKPEIQQMSDMAHAKYLRLWGNLENNLGHVAAAAAHYKAAFEYDSNSPGGLTLRGYAALLTDEPTQALIYLDRALAKERRSDTLALKVFALETLGRFEDIQALRAEESPNGGVDFVLALAQAAVDQGQLEVADADLQPLLTTEHAQDVRVKLALARVKITPLHLELQHAPRAMTEVPALLQDRPEIAEALDLINEVLTEPEGVARPLLEQASNLQQVILFWQNRFSELLEVVEQALKAHPNDVSALRHAALAQLSLGRPDDAWQSFIRIPEADRDVEVRMLGASAAERTGRAQEAVELLTGILQEDLGARARENAVLMATRALMVSNQLQEARDMLSHEANDSALIWLARAEVAEALKDQEHATEAFRQAVALASQERVVGFSLQYASYLRDQEQVNQAAEVVKKVIDQTQEFAYLSWMGSLLVQAGAFSDAKRIVDTLETQPDVSFETLALSANVYAGLELWEEAADRQGRLLELHPADANTLWNAVVISHKLQQTEETLKLLRRFALVPNISSRELMTAADLASQLAPSQEVLNWAYQARRKGHGDPTMHIKYLEIASRCPHEHNLATVQPESAVLLDYEDNEDTQRWIVLTADEAPSRELGEFALDSREAQLLLGQSLGTAVKLREGEGGTYEVRAIITKFANAERFFFQDFHELFPADNRMMRMRVFDPKPDAETGLPEEWQKIRKTAEKIARQRDDAAQVIARNRYAHVVNATLNLESATAFWQKVFVHQGTFLNFLADSADAQAVDGALSAKAWVIDVSALMSLASANQLNLLLLPDVPLQVTAQVEQQLEALASQHESVARALDFVRTHITVVTAPSAGDRLASIFPEETTSAMALAAAQELPLLTEDAGFRYSNRDGTLGPVLTSFGVIDILLGLLRTGRLDQPALETHLLPLLLAGRLFLPYTTALLQRAVSHDGVQIGPGIQAIMRMLLHPNITVQYQALIAGELLKLLWTQPDLGGLRLTVVRQFVAGLSAFDDRIQRFKQVYSVVIHLFRLLPKQAAEATAELTKAQATWDRH